jgi:hypothetical protein
MGGVLTGQRRDLRRDGSWAGSALNGNWLFDDRGWIAANELRAIGVSGAQDGVHNRCQNEDQERYTPKIHSKPSYWGGHWECT